MEKRLQELDKRIEAINKTFTSKPYDDFSSESPFDKKILNELLSSNFKLPQFKTYDETIDPINHAETFKAALLFQEASDAILCRAFLATLKGAAR